ncbi:MAG: M48 family metallopeptidase [Bdellovibrionota bacterium]
MKYANLDKQQQLLESNINVSKDGDLKVFLRACLKITFGIVCFVLIADLAAQYFILNMSVSTQQKIEDAIASLMPIPSKSEEDFPLLETANKIKERIVSDFDKDLPSDRFNFRVVNSKEAGANAFVAPDGRIYFTKELLDLIGSDEEILAFVVAHEVGHYKNRDHLRKVGRGFIILGGSLLLSDAGSATYFSDFLFDLLTMGYSRDAEKKADRYASDFMMKVYNSNRGAIDFFTKSGDPDSQSKVNDYFSSHPSDKTRVKYLLKWGKENKEK